LLGIDVEPVTLLRIDGGDAIQAHTGAGLGRLDLFGLSQHNRLGDLLVLEPPRRRYDSLVPALRQNNGQAPANHLLTKTTHNLHHVGLFLRATCRRP